MIPSHCLTCISPFGYSKDDIHSWGRLKNDPVRGEFIRVVTKDGSRFEFNHALELTLFELAK